MNAKNLAANFIKVILPFLNINLRMLAMKVDGNDRTAAKKNISRH